jgi:NPCBM/NEW2 domain/Melibiase
MNPRGSLRIFSIVMLCASVCMAAERDPLRIEGKLYAVECDPGTGIFSIIHKPTGKTFLRNGTTGETYGKASLATVEDPRFGKMTGIRITHQGGGSESIALPEDFPFVVFSSVIVNPGKEEAVRDKVPGVSADVDLGVPDGGLKTLGTGGLLPPEKNLGSYAFLAIADPASLNGLVGGWITQDRSSGVVFSPMKKNGSGCRIASRSEYGRLLIKPGASTAGELFALGYFEDTRSGLERYAGMMAAAMGVKLPPHKPGHCTWYMDRYAAACDEKHLAELADFAEKNLKPWGLDFLQIDDHWQAGTSTNGPKRNFMEHDPKGPYPSGMKAAAAMIASHGFTPGIWFIPFAGTWSDPFFHDHPDWFAKNPKGEPYEVGWGGTCLDMTAPGARDYLSGLVARVTRDWGYRLLKLDGFWTGSATKLTYVNNGYVEDGMGNAFFSDPSKPNIEVMRAGVKLVRKNAALPVVKTEPPESEQPGVFLLGCCLSQNMRSLAGSIGLVDSMRVGPDTGAGQIGALQASRLWFLNGRIWWNDPDCVSVRASVSTDQARLNASFAAISGAMFLNSDWIPDLPPERLDILRRCMPLHDLHSRPVDVLDREPASVWHLADTRKEPRRDVIALFNWSKTPSDVSVTPEKADLSSTKLSSSKHYVAFDFWAGKFVPPFSGRIGGRIPAKSARVLAVRPASSFPQLLSTSRHITQGMIDVSEERWDTSARTLTGSCDVVANDPDELRIVVPAGADSWIAGKISLSEEDRKAGVNATLAQDGPRIRAVISSPASRAVHWSIPFTRGSVSTTAPKPIGGLKVDSGYHGASLVWEENGADLYRVTRDDGVTAETAEPRFDDEGADTLKPRTYSVRAIGWDGTEGIPSSGTTPKLPPRPKNPPAPDTPLERMKPCGSPGAESPRIGRSWGGNVISLEGARHRNGLGVNAPSTLAYPVPQGATRFVAVVGLDDEVLREPGASVTMEVQGDVKEMGEKPQTLSATPVLSKEGIRSWAFDLALDPRFREIRLVSSRPEDCKTACHVDWVDAGFIVPKH